MSQEKLNNENANPKKNANDGDVRLAVKKKNFKKSDILVFGVCVVASVLIWLYASNLQKIADQKDMADKEKAAQAVIAEKEKEDAKEKESNGIADSEVNGSAEATVENSQ